MLEERAGSLERKGKLTTSIYKLCRAPSFKLDGKRRLVSPVTTRHSTSKRYPRLPRRDATERNKARLSPWTPSSAASAQAVRPQTTRHKATREARVKALKRGTARQKHQLPSSRRHRRPGPPSARGHVLSPEQTNKEACASKYSPRGRNTPTNELSHPPGWRSGAPGGCAASTGHVMGENRRITLWPNPLTRPKPQGLLSGTTIRDTLIGVLRSL